MAEYKNIWYTDGSEQVSAADSSYNQAVSIGDALQDLKFKTPIVCTSSTQMNLIYPNPKQYDRVYRADLGQELMWFEVYNSSTNPNGRSSSGWHPISDGLLSIYDIDAYTDGASNTLSANGKLSFTAAKNIYLPKIFTIVPGFADYKVVLNITNSSASSVISGQYMSDYTALTGATYLRTNMVSETATVGVPPSSQALTTSFNIQGSSSFRNCYAETTFFNPVEHYYSQCITQSSTANFSTSSRVQLSSTMYNDLYQSLEGIKIFGNGTSTFDGSVQVFRYQ